MDIFKLPWRCLRQRQIHFRSKREHQLIPDSEFVQAVAPSANDERATFIILLRRIVARECGVEPEMLWPNDSTTQLADVMGGTSFVEFCFGGPTGFDSESFYIELLIALGRNHPLEPFIDLNVITCFAANYWACEKQSSVTTKRLCNIGGWAAALSQTILERRDAVAAGRRRDVQE